MNCTVHRSYGTLYVKYTGGGRKVINQNLMFYIVNIKSKNFTKTYFFPRNSFGNLKSEKTSNSKGKVQK